MSKNPSSPNTLLSKQTSNSPQKISFAHGLNYYKLFWVFVIGCFLGVVIELLNCLYLFHTIESRSGVIYGPFNPVYGLGAVALTLCLYRFSNKNVIIIFGVGALSGGVVEYICSWLQETLFGTISWDYSAEFFHIQGRTCLKVCIYWGLLSILWIKLIYPFLSKMIEKIPNQIGKILTWILTVFFIFDLGISGLAVYRQKERSEDIPANNSVAEFLDQHYPDERLQEIYPNMLRSNPS